MSDTKKKSEELRSYRWFGGKDLRSFGHRSRAKQMGFGEADYEGKPVIGIVNTWSEINPCHFHLRQRAEEVKRGILQSGGFPVDGVVLMGGCDKTTPGLLMGAISVDLPAIFVPAGPMLRGNMRGQVLGSGSDAWRYWADLRAGVIDEATWKEVEDGIARSPGHCMTKSTASTMTSITARQDGTSSRSSLLSDSLLGDRCTTGSTPQPTARVCTPDFV